MDSIAGRILFYVFLVLFIANLSALIDLVHHPEISYFDEEHMITGGIAALIVASLLIALEVYLSKRSRTEEEIKGHTEGLEKLLGLSKEISATSDMKRLYRSILNTSKDLLKLDFVTLMVLSEDKARLILKDTVGFPESMINSFSLLEGQGLSTHVVLNKRPDAVTDFRDEKRFGVPPVVFEHRIRSGICVPMMAENEVFGALIGHTLEKRTFTQEEMSLFQTIGNQTAVAIKNAMHIKALRESEEKYRDLFEDAVDPIFIVDSDHNYRDVNRRAVELFGYTREEFLKMNVLDVIPPEQIERSKAEFEKLRERGAYEKFVGKMRRKDGIYVDVEVSSSAIVDGETVVGSRDIVRDITDRQRAEERISFLASIVETVPDGVCSIDLEGNILSWNEGAERMLGYPAEEIVGAPIATVIPPDLVERELGHCIGALNNEGYFEGYESVRTTKDGRLLPVEITAVALKDENGKIIRYASVMRDITDRKRMEEEILRARKLESIGLLAGGIAHDFNNLLMAILGNISLAKLFAKEGDDVYLRLIEAEKASLRARDLTRQLLTFSKGGLPVKKTVLLGALVEESAGFALRGSNVRCGFSLPSDLWPVEADEGQLSQVIHNLVLNAQQAMPKGGSIEIRCENVAVGTNGPLPIREGRYVKISVEDHGVGIPKEHLQNVFDPYFTTKQKGSGLGLATCYSIVKKHEGFIAVESEVGEGTTFRVYIPASEMIIAPDAHPKEEALAGRGRILVMDDEEMVRSVTAEMLTRMGYEVEHAGDGDETIETYMRAKESGRPFDAVIIDLTIPGGLGGKETIGMLRDLDPSVKAIVSSGYSNDPIMANFREYGFCAVASKPYTVEMLGQILNSVTAVKDK